MAKLTLTPSQALSRAISAYNAGKLVEAEQICLQIIDIKRDLFDALHLLAIVQSSLGKNDTALASYDRALTVRPDHAEALSNRGIALHELRRFEEAVASYDRALTVRPDYAEALFYRGLALHALKRFEEALAGYDRALTIRPEYAKALFDRGVALQELQRFEEALASYDRALKVQPDYTEALSNRGNVLYQLKRFEEALVSYDRALTVRPDYAEALSNRGATLKELKRFEEALASYDRALTVRPDYAEVLANRGVTLHELRRFEEALASYDHALTVRPDHAEALSNRGVTLHDLRRFEEALASYDRALMVRPDHAEALYNRGVTLQALQRFQEALASYDRALRIRPDYAEALCNLGNVLREQGRLGEAEAACRQAIALNPNLAVAYNDLGATLTNIGRLADARRAFEQAVQLAPQDTLHFLNLGDVRRFAAGDPYVAAMEELARNIALLPVNQQIELHFALAKAYEDLGRRNESFQQLLAGNALKRRQIAYDETTTLALFERIRALFTPELMRTFQNVGDQSSVPLFIVGMPRSGTTLIEQILASHPQVFGAGELPNLGEAAVSIRPDGGPIVPFPEVMLNISGKHLQRLAARYVYEITRLAPTATHVTDKMPSNFFYAGLIHLALPNARIIHVVRDPVDTCMSCFSTLFSGSQPSAYDLAELGRFYRAYEALMQHWHQVLPPGRILDVRYEDVVADLEVQARRIVVHCRLEWDRRCLVFHQTERPVHTASATQVRRPIYSSSIGRWRGREAFLRPLLAELSGRT
jgi:tetratricopeptide (TPR) repeat protein